MANSWNNIVKFCSDYIPGMPSYTDSSPNEVARTRGTVTIDEARRKQDAALQTLGLHRYKIPEDGNCMFRAVASQLDRDQDKSHPFLREAASEWAADHIEELLANGLLDSIDEVQQMQQLGTWQGQAALVALANVFNVNIAVVQGGDKGDVDIQHITPHDKSPRRNIVLAYLYSGHYDAASSRRRLSNPQYDRWQEECRHREEASVQLVKRLTDGEAHSHDTYDLSEQLARRLADEETVSHQDASEQLAWQLVREDAYFQELHDKRLSLPTTALLCSSNDSVNDNNGCTRTMTDTSSQHDSPARCEVDPVTGTRHTGRENSHNRNTPQKVIRKKSSRLAYTLQDDNSLSVRSSRTPSKDDSAKAVSQKNTVSREVVPTQPRTRPPRQTRGRRSESDDIHTSVQTVRAIATNRSVTTTLDRVRVCSYITHTPMKVNKKKAYESDDDLPDDALSPVRGTQGSARNTKTVGPGRWQTGRRVVSPSPAQPLRQSTRGRRYKANDSDGVAQSTLDRNHRLR